MEIQTDPYISESELRKDNIISENEETIKSLNKEKID